MRILWVKAGGLLPLDTGGKIRSYNLLRQLALRHQVDVFTYYPSHENDMHWQIAAKFHRAYCLSQKMPSRGSLKDTLCYVRNAVTNKPYTVAKFSSSHVRRRLRQLVERERYDIILCDFIFPVLIIPWDLNVPVIVFTHNVEAMIWQRHYQLSRNPLFKLLSYREFRTMDRLEHTYLPRASHVLTVSPKDLEVFASYVDRSRLTVIPTGVDTTYFHPEPESETADTLVFCGSMDWMPNEDGVFWFVRSVLPLIAEKVPGVRTIVVGRRPSDTLKQLATEENSLVVTGTVDDIRPYLAQGSVCVVPLRVAGGTRIKIFEAFAMGIPVVSTTIGAEGLPVEDGRHLYLADTAEDFAERTVRLLRDNKEREQLRTGAREMVVSQYSWEAVSVIFERALASLAKDAQQPSFAISSL